MPPTLIFPLNPSGGRWFPQQGAPAGPAEKADGRGLAEDQAFSRSLPREPRLSRLDLSPVRTGNATQLRDVERLPLKSTG